VPAAPDGLGQPTAFGYEAAEARTNSTKGGGRGDKIHRLCYRSLCRTSGGVSLSWEQGRDFLSTVSAILPLDEEIADFAGDYVRWVSTQFFKEFLAAEAFGRRAPRNPARSLQRKRGGRISREGART